MKVLGNGAVRAMFSKAVKHKKSVRYPRNATHTSPSSHTRIHSCFFKPFTGACVVHMYSRKKVIHHFVGQISDSLMKMVKMSLIELPVTCHGAVKVL